MNLFKKKTDDETEVPVKEEKHYLSGKEVRAIAKENNKVMRELEKYKNRKAEESEFVTEMKDPANILEVENLHSYFFTDQGVVKAVNGVTFNVPQGATVGIVGESGCGKSVTSMSVMRLLQGPQGQIVEGGIRFKSFDFKLGEDGKPIPIWEDDENGQPIFDPVYVKKGKEPVWEDDENGQPVYVPVLKKTGTEPDWAEDENGQPIFDPVYEKKGMEPVWDDDENGDPVYETVYVKKGMEPVWDDDENGNPVYEPVMKKTGTEPVWWTDEKGEPILYPVLGKNGKPIFDENGAPVREFKQRSDNKGRKMTRPVLEPKLDENGNPVTERRQKRDERGKKVFKPVLEPKLDENGDPVTERRQKKDEKGKKVFKPVLEPKFDENGDPVTERRQRTDGKGKKLFKPVYEPVLGEDGQPLTERRQKVDEKGRKLFKPLLVAKLDKEGNPVTERRQKRDEYGTKLYEMEEKVFDIAKMPIKEMYRLRGRQIAMIFQEPMTSLNPVFTIGNQLDEVTLLHVPGATAEEAKKRSIEMLNLVGIAMPERVYKSYPHELSGGMRQRVMIAMALEGNPRLIIADEPTTALDVTIQAQILDLLRGLKDRINGSILLITHDLGVIAEMADFVVVMYAGRIIEQGTASEIFHDPKHPYTIGLQKSKPTMDSKSESLFNIPGNVPNPVNMPNYCYFRERCSGCNQKCYGDYPEMVQVSPTHWVACHLYGEDTEKNAKENVDEY